MVSFPDWPAWTWFLLGLATITLIFATIVLNIILAQVNQRLPPEEQFSYFFDYPGKQTKIIRSHRALYPTSRLRFTYYALFVIAVCLLLIWAWVVGIF